MADGKWFWMMEHDLVPWNFPMFRSLSLFERLQGSKHEPVEQKDLNRGYVWEIVNNKED